MKKRVGLFLFSLALATVALVSGPAPAQGTRCQKPDCLPSPACSVARGRAGAGAPRRGTRLLRGSGLVRCPGVRGLVRLAGRRRPGLRRERARRLLLLRADRELIKEAWDGSERRETPGRLPPGWWGGAGGAPGPLRGA